MANDVLPAPSPPPAGPFSLSSSSSPRLLRLGEGLAPTGSKAPRDAAPIWPNVRPLTRCGAKANEAREDPREEVEGDGPLRTLDPEPRLDGTSGAPHGRLCLPPNGVRAPPAAVLLTALPWDTSEGDETQAQGAKETPLPWGESRGSKCCLATTSQVAGGLWDDFS